MPPPSGSRAPRLLVVGHLTEDLDPDGESRLGGAAAYAGLLAHRFGVRVSVLTAVDPEFPWLDALAGIDLLVVPSPGRTRFENRYRADGSRAQRILTRAAPIPDAEVQRAVAALPEGSAVLYAPVAGELGAGAGPPLPRPPEATGPETSAVWRQTLAAAAPQGFLRRFDEDGQVLPHLPAGLGARLSGLDLVALSGSDLGEEREIPGLRGPRVAITRGRFGAVLHGAGRPERRVPPVPATEVDPTGAGDTFAAALVVSLWTGLPEPEAARRAAAAAAIAVESRGVEGAPSLRETLARTRPRSPTR